MSTRTPLLTPRRVFALAALLLVFATLALTVGTGRWQIRPILSGSMRPGFPVGGVAITEREPLGDLQVNDVIVTHPPGEPTFDLVHRVIQVKSRTADWVEVQTKGDDNLAADPFTIRVKGPWIYRAHFTLPVVGYAALAVHSPSGRRGLLIIAGVLLLVALSRAAFTNRRGRQSAQPAVAPSGDTGSSGAGEPGLGDAGNRDQLEEHLSSAH